MDIEESCDTSLSLGFMSRKANNLCGRPLNPPPQLEPSLTISSTTILKKKEGRLSSSHSTISSFSTSNIKKEKTDICGGKEEAEVERGTFSRASEEEEDASARKKLRLTKEQSALLEDRFKEHSTLNPKQKQALAKQLNLRPRQIEVWFQNRRARTKLKQTEVDCEFLRRCCDSLTEENRRLQKELQELKALKFLVPQPPPPPVFMHLPAATLTVCPSCERITGTGKTINGAAKKADAADISGGGGGAFKVTAPIPQQHFFNPFVHSASC